MRIKMIQARTIKADGCEVTYAEGCAYQVEKALGESLVRDGVAVECDKNNNPLPEAKPASDAAADAGEGGKGGKTKSK